MLVVFAMTVVAGIGLRWVSWSDTGVTVGCRLDYSIKCYHGQ